jgi:diguanylate cyclase (GGDEF)-like protein
MQATLLPLSPQAGQDSAAPGTPSTGGALKPGSTPDLMQPDLMQAVSSLLESRLRWHDMALLAADLAFETDVAGRFTFIAPDIALGWEAASLIGTDSGALLADPVSDPFRTEMPVRGVPTWLRRSDGRLASVLMAAAPVIGPAGERTGVRGLAVDTTEATRQDETVSASLRRLEVLDHILTQMRQEVLASRMLDAALTTLVGALGSEGAAVVGVGGPQDMLGMVGEGSEDVLALARDAVFSGDGAVAVRTSASGHSLLIVGTYTRYGEVAGLAVWRAVGGRAWDDDECRLLESASAILRVILEQGAIQREMSSQARTDALTGLYNRRAFLEELPRRIDRLERENGTGTLMYVDLDGLKGVNDRLGHEMGDAAIRLAATRLRDAARPTDLVARLGGDEFAVWMDGADRLTAAERAELLCHGMPGLMLNTPAGEVKLGFSIGVAERPCGAFEDVDGLLHRADQAMYAAKTNGRGRWHAAGLPE